MNVIACTRTTVGALLLLTWLLPGCATTAAQGEPPGSPARERLVSCSGTLTRCHQMARERCGTAYEEVMVRHDRHDTRIPGEATAAPHEERGWVMVVRCANVRQPTPRPRTCLHTEPPEPTAPHAIAEAPH